MSLNNLQKRQKLRTLAKIEGYSTVTELLEASARDSVSPAICCNPEELTCHYTTEMEARSRRRLVRGMRQRHDAIGTHTRGLI